MPVSPIPEGCHSLTPYLVVRGAAAAIDFYKTVFGATEHYRIHGPGGTIGHAELTIGDSRLMLADETPAMGAIAPPPAGTKSFSLALYVEDADAVFARAVGAGATVIGPVRDQFYGDRSGTFTDPFGHLWTVATHKEDVSPAELQRRAEAMFKPPA